MSSKMMTRPTRFDAPATGLSTKIFAPAFKRFSAKCSGNRLLGNSRVELASPVAAAARGQHRRRRTGRRGRQRLRGQGPFGRCQRIARHSRSRFGRGVATGAARRPFWVMSHRSRSPPVVRRTISGCCQPVRCDRSRQCAMHPRWLVNCFAVCSLNSLSSSLTCGRFDELGRALDIMSAVDGVVLVVEAEFTRRSHVRAAKERLSGTRLLGSALNKHRDP